MSRFKNNMHTMNYVHNFKVIKRDDITLPAVTEWNYAISGIIVYLFKDWRQGILILVKYLFIEPRETVISNTGLLCVKNIFWRN